ncbi:protein MIZU-KUSSEI 1 [Brassica rapa]|uniref:Protein MIZU-KUSSEI 1 n=1 Tax=Brassica campestris TaxID=3711 RepID=M4CYK4_BRACM|nr:protein MIZU-KUSSEI 1 [Brassica rapa]
MATPPLTPRMLIPTTLPPLGSPRSKESTVRPEITLEQPSGKTKSTGSKSNKLLRRVRSVFRSLPIMSPMCKFPGGGGTRVHENHVHHGGTRVTGTLFGYRKTRVNMAIQETPRSLPILVLELAIPTAKLLQDLGVGLVRIALECEKRPSERTTKIVDEPIWALYCNGKKSGYGVKRQPTEEDLVVMQMLHAVSMGAGVLPVNSGGGGGEGDLTYMRAHFERVIGSRDSETYYMMNPDGNSGPELSIFFVRV